MKGSKAMLAAAGRDAEVTGTGPLTVVTRLDCRGGPAGTGDCIHGIVLWIQGVCVS